MLIKFRSSIVICACFTVAFVLTGCKLAKNSSTPDEPSSSSSSRGVEKVKPAPGTGNVQGKVLYNGKPVPNDQVKLCEKFSQFIGGCSGQTYTARTASNGEYVITNVEPKEYESLIAYVFDTNFYVFATTGIGGLSATKYKVVAGQTFFVDPINLFKDDLKVISPKAGSKISGQNVELKWEPYPDAAFYKFSLYPSDMAVTSPYINERVDDPAFTASKPLSRGTYRLEIKAYNSSGTKLAECSDDIKFEVE